MIWLIGSEYDNISVLIGIPSGLKKNAEGMSLVEFNATIGNQNWRLNNIY